MIKCKENTYTEKELKVMIDIIESFCIKYRCSYELAKDTDNLLAVATILKEILEVDKSPFTDKSKTTTVGSNEENNVTTDISHSIWTCTN